MINNFNNNRFNLVKSLAILALVLTIATTSLIGTLAQAEELTPTSTESSIVENELTWVEDNSEVFYPTEGDVELSEAEVQKLGLEVKYNQQLAQDLKLEFKTDFKSELKLNAGFSDQTTRQAELNLVSDSINKDFQNELQAKRDLEAKQYSEFEKLSNIYKEASGIYNDVNNKVNNVLKTENLGVKIVTDVVLDNITADKDLKGFVKLLLNGNNSNSDYQKYNFDQDINRLKNLFK